MKKIIFRNKIFKNPKKIEVESSSEIPSSAVMFMFRFLMKKYFNLI